MIDPTAFGHESLDELVVAYIDGALTADDSRRFESTFITQPQLRARVERARCLRALVATLPRVAVPDSVRRYTDRLATLPRVTAGSPAAASSAARVEFAMGLLPRRSAPQGFAAQVMFGVRAEKARVQLAARRRAFRPSGREWLRAAVAALLLFGVSMTLASGRSVDRSSSHKFSFAMNVIRPGQEVDAVVLAHADPILVPRSPSLRGAVAGSLPNLGSSAGAR